MCGLQNQIQHKLKLNVADYSFLKVPFIKNQTKIFFLFLLTSLSIQAQQFDLIGAPGANGGVNQISINLDKPSTIFASYNFGLFKSDDFGKTVEAVNTPFNQFWVNDLQVFNENNTIVFGEISTGYYKSTDNGKSWIMINADKDSRKVIRLNPINKDIYYIKKNNNELWRSNDKGLSWYKLAKFNEEIISFDIFPVDTSLMYVATFAQLYKTTNSGKDWVKKAYLPGTWSMNINPLNSNILYIQTGGILQKSVDGGETIFEILKPQVYTFKLSLADTSVLFASILMDDIGLKQGINKSTDGGLTWQLKMNGIEYDPLSWIPATQTIEINPQNVEEVYIGVDQKGVYKTIDGGDNWYHTNLSYMEASHFSTDKNNQDEFVIGNRGWGLMKTGDGGKNWYYPYFDIQPSQIFSTERCFDFNPVNKMEGFLAGSNYLYSTSDGGTSWFAIKSLNYVNYGTVFFHKYSPNVIFLIANQGPYLSSDYGSTWTKSEGGGTSNHIRFVRTDINMLYDYDLINVGNDSYKFVAKRSTDLGKSWIQINNGLLTSPETNKNLDITSLEPDIDHPNIAYCGQRGGLSKTTNGGENWFQVDSSLKELEPPWLSVTSVLLDPTMSGRIYVGIRGSGVPFTDQFTKGGLYLTEDDCKTWRQVFTGSVVGLYSDEGNPRRVFINTYQGVFRFLDTLTVTDIKEHPNDFPKDFLLNQNYPNPFNPSTTISYQIPSSSFVTFKVYDVLGNEVAVLVNEWKESGSYNYEFGSAKGGRNYELPSGVYFYQLISGEFMDTKKLILLK